MRVSFLEAEPARLYEVPLLRDCAKIPLGELRRDERLQ